MKFIKLHTKNTTIVYKNAICSTATVLVLVFIVLSVMIPILLVSLLSPYSGISESRVLYEQPTIKYKYQYIFVAEVLQNDEDLDTFHTTSIVCSTLSQLNKNLKNSGKQCAAVKYWNEDTNHDGRVDFANFQLELDALPGSLLNFDLILFFEAELKHKCKLSPPALLTQRFTLPANSHDLQTSKIVLKAELQLKQHIEFYCPFLGHNFQTKFHAAQLYLNDTDDADTFDVQQYQLEALLQQVKRNSAYFQMHLQESYAKTQHSLKPLSIELQLQILQVPARYHLSVWERLGQFWLYFASFFGISFYIMNKLKDFLFGRHIVRAWEVIPWKKLY